MFFDSLTTLTLIWFIYTYFLVEGDKELGQLLNRVKSALSLNSKGIVQQKQLIALEKFSFPELASYRNAIGSSNTHYVRLISQVLSKRESVSTWKKIIYSNMFILTALVVINIFGYTNDCFLILIKAHVILSLLLSGAFYYFCISKIQDIKLLGP